MAEKQITFYETEIKVELLHKILFEYAEKQLQMIGGKVDIKFNHTVQSDGYGGYRIYLKKATDK